MTASDNTLAQIRSLISPSSFPPDPDTGGAPTSAQQTALINRVRELFYNPDSGEAQGALWLGTRQVLVLTVQTQPDSSKTLTLPRGFGKIEGIYDGQGPMSVRNQWFSYLEISPTNPIGSRSLDDMGYGFAGVVDFPTTGSGLTLTTTKNEAGGLQVILFGVNSTGGVITETVTLPTVAGNSVASANMYYGLTQIVLPITVGSVQATQTVGAVFFALYGPGEVSPNYRRYRINTGTSATTLTAICIRKYYPLIADTDPCEFGSILAFEAGLRAYQWLQNSDMDHYRNAMAAAIGFLNGELAASQSETSEGFAMMETVTSGGAIRNLV